MNINDTLLNTLPTETNKLEQQYPYLNNIISIKKIFNIFSKNIRFLSTSAKVHPIRSLYTLYSYQSKNKTHKHIFNKVKYK